MLQPDRNLSRERFGRFAENYVASVAHASGDDLELLVEMASPQPDDAVLDVATGGGHTAIALAARVGSVVASDLTPEMLDAARAHAERRGAENVRFELAQAESLPFDDASFDIVACRIAAHHFGDPHSFLGEAWRVLRDGGRFVLEDQEAPADAGEAAFINDFERLRDPSHLRSWSAEEWVRETEAAGFEVTRVEHVAKGQTLRDWAERQGCDEDTIACLGEMLRSGHAGWYRPRPDGEDVAFEIPQVLLAAVKREAR